jgi:hypothetical protein
LQILANRRKLLQRRCSALHRLRRPVKVLIGHLQVVFLGNQPTMAEPLADDMHRELLRQVGFS